MVSDSPMSTSVKSPSGDSPSGRSPGSSLVVRVPKTYTSSAAWCAPSAAPQGVGGTRVK